VPQLVLALLLVAPPAVGRPACPPASASSDALLRGAFALHEAEQDAPARDCFERALARARAEADPAAEAESRRGLGRALVRLGRRDEGAAELEAALALFEEQADPLGAGRVRAHLGSLAHQRDQRARAFDLYQTARTAFEAIGPAADRDRAQVLYNLVLLETFGDATRPLLDEGLGLARRLPDLQLEGRFLQVEADAAANAGEYAAALEKYRAALGCFERARAPARVARALVGMSRLALAQGDTDQSLALSRRALGIQQEIGDARGVALSLDYLATASSRLGRHREALRLFDRASRWARDRGEQALLDTLAVRSAEAHERMGAHAQALERVRAGLGPALPPDFVPGAYDVLARACLGLSRHAEALAAADRAVGLARERSVPLFAPLETRARARQATGDVPGALADVREAIEVVERTRARLVPTDFLKQGFGERHQALFARAIDLLERQGLAEEALQVAEQARARAFQDLLATRAAPVPRTVPASEEGGLESTRHAAAPTVSELAAIARRLDSTVVSYWVGPEATFVWTLDGTGALHLARAPVGAARLARLVAAAAAGPQTLTERGAAPAPKGGRDPASARRELYRLLVLPVEPWLPRENGRLLTIVPHGPLFRVSFAALRDRRGRYLVERYAMHYVPAGGVLRFSADARLRAAGAPPRALLVADPVPLPSASGARLGPLPGARAEVDAVRAVLGGDASRLVARAATEADVVTRLAESTTIHLATHGLVDDEHSLDSFVALGRTGVASGTDGRLTVGEVYDLRLRADLVFLSACQSGRGRVTGDGILGLTRAFLSAGAATVVATLWDVADEPSSQLVPRFYEGLAQGASKSRALRAAQLALMGRLRSGRVRLRSAAGEGRALPEDPALWAAFVVVGEP
jgi:CHAT domain-containing protein/tetratricopeptide (TPR) repeat protein